MNQDLDTLRHDAAHILAQAVKKLYPDVQITIGPTIDTGFYYDFAKTEPFSMQDLEAIEKEMLDIVRADLPFEKMIWTRDQAIDYFLNQQENYKVEIIKQIPESQDISVYKQGDFIDLCRGPHGKSTGWVKFFKLTKLAGAYWRGDSKNQMLQRIYGTAFHTKEELDQYLKFLEEAERRDHRRIGKELDLFHIQEEARGMVFWHPKGWTIFRAIQDYMRKKLLNNGYVEVNTPILVDRSLWEKSGHWEKFKQNMFTSLTDDETLALKPMNCPCHIQIFNCGIKSYRDLPLRMMEFGSCHRYEPSGSLHGLMRVRCMVQDDAHIFCTEEDITKETVEFCKLLQDVYKDFGFTEIKVRFSDRPQVRAGDDATWDIAENALMQGAEAASLKYVLNKGDGAFYGPKLEFVLSDAIGREWQCGTLQMDFVLPERLNAWYVDREGQKRRPAMLHRAILGSFERFIGILLEHYEGKLPLWLAPVQVAIATVTNDSQDLVDYAQYVRNQLQNHNIRCILDISSEKVGYKIRSLSVHKIPIIVILGKSELESNQVAVRMLGSNNVQNMTMDAFIKHVNELINI